MSTPDFTHDPFAADPGATDLNSIIDQRIAEALAKRDIGLDDLPLADLKRSIENTLQPDASTFLSPGSVGVDSINSSVGLFRAGDLKSSARTTAENGWLLCNGAAVSRTAYAALFAAIGAAYGAGDASTTFNVPDLQGRVLVGAGTPTGAAGAGAHALGAKGGEQTHLLSTAEMPSHSHGGVTGNDSPDHTHQENSAGGASLVAAAGTNYGVAGTTQTSSGASVRHQHSISAEGGSTAHNVEQPFTVVNIFIKT